MNHIVLDINDTGNSAFEDFDFEVARILQSAAEQFKESDVVSGFKHFLFDYNGNRVGQVRVVQDSELQAVMDAVSDDSVSLTVELGNAAFDGREGDEVSRIIESAAEQVLQGGVEAIALFDYNGNKVGNFKLGDELTKVSYKYGAYNCEESEWVTTEYCDSATEVVLAAIRADEESEWSFQRDSAGLMSLCSADGKTVCDIYSDAKDDRAAIEIVAEAIIAEGFSVNDDISFEIFTFKRDRLVELNGEAIESVLSRLRIDEHQADTMKNVCWMQPS